MQWFNIIWAYTPGSMCHFWLLWDSWSRFGIETLETTDLLRQGFNNMLFFPFSQLFIRVSKGFLNDSATLAVFFFFFLAVFEICPILNSWSIPCSNSRPTRTMSCTICLPRRYFPCKIFFLLCCLLVHLRILQLFL